MHVFLLILLLDAGSNLCKIIKYSLFDAHCTHFLINLMQDLFFVIIITKTTSSNGHVCTFTFVFGALLSLSSTITSVSARQLATQYGRQRSRSTKPCYEPQVLNYAVTTKLTLLKTSSISVDTFHFLKKGFYCETFAGMHCGKLAPPLSTMAVFMFHSGAG